VTIRPGEEWSRPAGGEPDAVVAGGDAALAAAVHDLDPGVLVRFTPDAGSDLARAVGLRGEPTGTTEAALDALDLGGRLAVNIVVAGVAPDRVSRLTRSTVFEIQLDGTSWFSGSATSVVVATGQFLRGADVAPRGHPGDGRAEVQVYALRPRERRLMRGRLATGAHVPHPRIAQRPARQVTVNAIRPFPVEIDGAAMSEVNHLAVELIPGRYRLLL
jgi:diacylglycerol kinase family enzyme